MKPYYRITGLLLLAASTVMLYSQKSVYTFPFENSYRLPPMQSYINTEDISNTYQTMGNIFTTEITGLGDEPMEQTSMSFISDAKVVDAVRFLEFYLEDHLVAPGEDPSGLVEMSIIYYHEHYRINVGTVLSVLTFGLGTLFGVPYATSITDVEVEASIYDDYDHLMATHRGVGRGKKLQTLYSMNNRKAHQRALRKALEALNNSIMSDPDLEFLAVN